MPTIFDREETVNTMTGRRPVDRSHVLLLRLSLGPIISPIILPIIIHCCPVFSIQLLPELALNTVVEYRTSHTARELTNCISNAVSRRDNVRVVVVYKNCTGGMTV
jgi:hypothetical protein